MTANEFYKIRCVNCKTYHKEEDVVAVCPVCHEALDIEYDYKAIKGRLNYYALKNSPMSSRKYLDFYPIKNLNEIVTRNEGGTSLVVCKNLREKYGTRKLFIKDEVTNPTGCYKDRGSLVELSKAKELGAKAVCCASTGNMAASVSAYAAIAKLPCYVLVPEGTPMGKMAQSLAYGARIIQIRGTYVDCVKLCEEMAKKHKFYLAGDYVFRMEGQKSIAYEICEQLFWKAPDYCIVPMGCGTLISSIWKGFKEFHSFGFIDKLPKMIGVQPENVPTIVEAFRTNKKRAIEIEKPNTVASAVGIGKPQDDIKALNALRESKGNAETASEQEILEAQLNMSRNESIFVEPSSAIPIAVLDKLLNKKIIKKDDVIVCVTTGIGLKDPKSAISVLPDPPVLEPHTEEIERYLKFRLYDIKASGVEGKEKVLWKQVPNKLDLKKIISREFNLKLNNDYLSSLHSNIANYHEKNDEMKKANLQYILESILKENRIKKEILKIQDYELFITKHSKPKAKVILTFKGKTIKQENSGVGPVDAVILAIRTAIKGMDTLDVYLIDYNVEIDTKGTDATVEVKMILKDKKNNIATAIGVSPDVIVASIEAFEKGYNTLYAKGK
jgi:threonine synthase